MTDAPAITRISGIVEAVNRMGTGLKLRGGEWHNYSLPQYRGIPWENPSPGDAVILTEVESNGRSYVSSISIDVPAPTQNAHSGPVEAPGGPIRDDRPIVTRLAVLNTAARIYAVAPNSADADIATQDVIRIAERLLTWAIGGIPSRDV